VIGAVTAATVAIDGYAGFCGIGDFDDQCGFAAGGDVGAIGYQVGGDRGLGGGLECLQILERLNSCMGSFPKFLCFLERSMVGLRG
jgi:hypothetical protein